MTFQELKDFCATLNPEQLAMRVMWMGEERGGAVRAVEVMAEDQINPSGDGMEPRSECIRQLVEQDKYTPAEAEATLAVEQVVAVKGQPLLVVD